MSDVSTARKTKKDMYANVAYGSVTMSAANTLTFSAIQMAVGLFQGIAMIIHSIEYRPTAASCREMVAATDAMYIAITSSNRLSTLVDVSDPAVIDQKHIVGVGVSVEPWTLPLITDLTAMPGGGKIVSANPLYLAMQTAGAAAASVCRVTLNFTFVAVSDRDYLEIIQSQFPANIT